MKNTFGNLVTITLFGESHGMAIGAVIDGLPAGLKVDKKIIRKYLRKRQPCDEFCTPRQEKDKFSILSGVFNGYTTGTPLTIIISNTNVQSNEYQYGIARPGHVDYVASQRYHGFEDYRGGGHFSGRITVALVAISGILIPVLETLGVKIGTHIFKCGDISDREFITFSNDFDLLEKRTFPVLNDNIEEQLAERISSVVHDGDSIGGITQTAICGLPVGVGEPWFDSIEGMLAHALFSIGGIKGVEFGLGFKFADKHGSEVNDSIAYQDDKVQTKTNYSGGINGGLTNGMPVVFQCVVKPTASIAKEQDTIDFVNKENVKLTVKGRHDPAIIRRICPVIDSVASLVVIDMLAQRYGADILLKKDLLCNLV